MTVKRTDGREEHNGKVLKLLRKENPAWYSVYALVWNEAIQSPEEVYLYTGPYGDVEASAEIDADEATREQFAKWMENAPDDLRAKYGD